MLDAATRLSVMLQNKYPLVEGIIYRRLIIGRPAQELILESLIIMVSSAISLTWYIYARLYSIIVSRFYRNLTPSKSRDKSL